MAPSNNGLLLPCPQVPVQLALVVAHLYWCQDVEAALAAANPAAALDAQLSTNIKQLQALTALVRGALSGLERKVGCAGRATVLLAGWLLGASCKLTGCSLLQFRIFRTLISFACMGMLLATVPNQRSHLPRRLHR